MKEFKIFEKQHVWTRTNVINCIILVLVLIILFISLILKIEKSTFLNSLLSLVFASYFIGMSLKLSNMNRVQQLQGSLTGKFVFEKDYIQINELRINIESIKRIEITGVDWIGLRNSNYLLNFNYENGLSNGTKNYLLIEYSNDNKKQKIQFQQNDACEFKEIEEVIKYYYINNKIGYLNCVDILCLSEQQWNEFKNLNKHYS